MARYAATGRYAPPMERLARRVVMVPPSDCHLWTGAVNSAGYGQIGVDGKLVYTHRLAYEAVHGAIPEGLTIDHLCRTPACCNPAHLEAVTMAENLRRGTSPSHRLARLNECHRGHPLSGENVYVARSGRRHCLTCRRHRRAEAKERDLAARGQ